MRQVISAFMSVCNVAIYGIDPNTLHLQRLTREEDMGNNQPPERLEWEAPAPQTARRGSRWDPIAKALKARPGQWACIGRDIPTGIVSTVRTGGLICFKHKGAFEAVVRNHTSRWSGDVYVRYVGENQEHA